MTLRARSCPTCHSIGDPHEGCGDLWHVEVRDPEKPPAQSLVDQLAEVLPAHTHADRPVFGLGTWTWTWTTPAGTWKVTKDMFAVGWRISGTGGSWTVPAERVIPALRGLGGIPAEGGEPS